MAVAAAGGLDAPGLSPSDLQLNARLCRLLAERFPEVMVIPSGETRTLALQVGPRRDSSASVVPASTPPCQGASSPASSNSTGRFASGVGSAGGDFSGDPRSRRTLSQHRRARLKSLTPTERLRRLSHPTSATAAGSRRKPHQPPDQPYSIPLPGEEGHEEVMDLLAGDDLGAVSDGELLRMSTLSSTLRRPRFSRRSVGSRPTTVVSRPASPASDDVFPDFEAGSPAEDVEFDPLADAALACASPLGEASVPGSLDSSMTTATSGPVAAISSTAVTTVVLAAPTLDPAVVGGSSPCEFTAGSAISNSAATAPGSASPVQASVSTPAGSAVDVASRSVAVSTTPAANSAGAITSTLISAGVSASVPSVVATSVITSDSTVAPMPDSAESVMATSGSPQPSEHTATPVTSSTSALDSADIAGLVSSSAEVPASTPSSAEAFVSAPDSAGVSATTPDSAGVSPSTADTAAVSATTPVSAAPAPTASGSTVTDVVTSSSVAPATSVPDSGVPAAPAVLRLLACPRGQSARQSHGDSVSRALTAGSGISSTSTQSTVPTPDQGMVSPSGRPRRASAINAARLSSHYLGELKVYDRVALGLGDPAGSSPDSAMQGEGSSAQPLELSGDSSEGEPEGTVVSSPESASGREQLGHREGSAVSGPKARAQRLRLRLPTETIHSKILTTSPSGILFPGCRPGGRLLGGSTSLICF
ncbi:unnamed protein product [Phytophthora fragariaefolia]|uniref:Unnamed protein product n=1 Tax=Phytophthora fragariaefolia TaxID=1490495 RepID=A0A9W7D8E6_9STRA|nr:unnamed protein product [Phytophthora fragariaefolia]